MSGDQNATTSVSSVVAFVFRNKAHAEHVLTGCPDIHGEEVIDCLHAETLSIELSKGGRKCTEALRGGLHCGLFTKDHRTGLAVSLNVKMSSKTSERGCDLVEESLRDRVRARSSPHLDFGGLKFKID